MYGTSRVVGLGVGVISYRVVMGILLFGYFVLLSGCLFRLSCWVRIWWVFVFCEVVVNYFGEGCVSWWFYFGICGAAILGLLRLAYECDFSQVLFLLVEAGLNGMFAS